jgi:uncharacterized protein YdhG (YjbR/CyaY superfamily)
MNTKKVRPKDVDEYIAAAPQPAQQKLRQMRACLRAATPGATESLKYGMPAFSYKRILVIYGAFRHHIGFYPTASAVTAFAKALARYHTAKGSIQFPLESPLPLPLIRKITAFRVRESLQHDKTWRS